MSGELSATAATPARGAQGAAKPARHRDTASAKDAGSAQPLPPPVAAEILGDRPRGRAPLGLVIAFACLAAAGCGFNEVVERDEEVKQAWGEVENQYQRRLDLVPNLVATVKGSANFEQATLTAVIEARAKAAGVKIDASQVEDPARLKAFEESQAQLSGSLGRLMVVAERYPELKASAAFRDLQGQLEGTENRIAVARQRFGTQVAAYNKVVLVFPSLIGARLRGKGVRPTFSSAAGADRPPQVQF